MSETVIKAENLSKYYRLGQINNGMLFRDIQTWFARKFGKEDPHSQIGSVYDPNAEGFWALKDLNFEIKQGERVGIIGKNGAGKSTLLKILSQITAPTEGSLKIRGRIASLLEVGTGFHPEMTGRENIYLNGAILGMKKKEIDKKIDEIIAFSEIEKHIDTPVKRYSSGMYVRLAFAIAAHLDSDILIADEVLAVGDAAFQKKALGKMNELSTGEGRTVLFVSHQMNAVRQLCNRGIVLEKGRIIRQDDDINDSIKWYLGTGENGSIRLTTDWKNDGRFKNEYFAPVSLGIYDETEHLITEALDYNKSYKLRLEFDTTVPNSNVDFWIIVYKGIESFASFGMPIDYTAKKGRNVIEYAIPARSLLPNSYILSLGSSVKNAEWIVNSFNYEIIINVTMTNSISDGVFPINVK